jgi:acyl-coenzyme A thioesterase PaaI-like protein
MSPSPTSTGDEPPEGARITPSDFETLIAENMNAGERFDFSVEAFEFGRAVLRLRITQIHLRPGATVAGPVMFMLADTALYAAVLTMVGMQPLAVTTDMTLHFLKRPRAVDMIADARIHRAGSKLMYGDVFMRSVGDEDPVCHATGTYAVPPRRRRSQAVPKPGPGPGPGPGPNQ